MAFSTKGWINFGGTIMSSTSMFSETSIVKTNFQQIFLLSNPLWTNHYLESHIFRNELLAFTPKLYPFTSAPCDHHFKPVPSTPGYPVKCSTVFIIPLHFNLLHKRIFFLRKVKKALKFIVILWEVFLFQGRQGRLTRKPLK